MFLVQPGQRLSFIRHPLDYTFKIKMLSFSEAREIINSGEPVDIVIHKKNGERIEANNVVCTSSYHKGNTFKLKFLDSNEFRDMKAVLLTELNGEEIYL